MSERLSIAIVGAGSSYTPALIAGLLAQPADLLPVTDLRLYDTSSARMTIMADLARRMIADAGRQVRVTESRELEAALAGVGYVITQIRVGGMEARYLDESIPLKYGILGQETTGPGGMFKALRTIPAMLDIARTVARVAPQAFILNYSNPSGILAEAVCRHTRARMIGLCSGIPNMQTRIKTVLSDPYPDLRIYTVGLNHLGFMHRLISGGQDVTRDAIGLLAEQEAAAGEDPALGPASLMKFLGAIPISYTQYYFYRQKKVAEAAGLEKTRAQQIMDIERDVFAQASDPSTVGPPEALAKRGGDGYSAITFDFLKAIHHDTGAELACTVPNRGAVEGIDPDAGVEVVCRVGRDGPSPLPVGPIPLAFRGLVLAVKAYETLTIQAALEQRKSLVWQALANHPLVGDLDIIEPLVDEMLAAHHLAYAS